MNLKGRHREDISTTLSERWTRGLLARLRLEFDFDFDFEISPKRNKGRKDGFSKERRKKGSLSLTTSVIECKERKNNLRGGSEHFRTGYNNMAKNEEEGRMDRRNASCIVGLSGDRRRKWGRVCGGNAMKTNEQSIVLLP